VRTVECVVANQCYSHQPSSLKFTDSKLYLTKLLLFVMRFTLEVLSTTVTYFSLQKTFLIRIQITLSKNPKSQCAQRDDAMVFAFISHSCALR